ncbi:MAG: hypothetical protein QHH14_09010 [Clostridiales bacterium]|nr:hypothetical protein [Clostridiales bacterium]
MRNRRLISVDGKRGLSRREFLTGCAGCTAYASIFSLARGKAAASSPPLSQHTVDGQKPKIRLVFTHIAPDRPTWPNIGYDYEGRKTELTAKLRKALPEIEFLPVTVQSAQEAEKLLQNDQDVDGYVVYIVGIWTGAVRKIASSGKPTVLVDDLYAGSGEFLIEYAASRRQSLKVAGVSSSRFEDVVAAVRCFECIKKLRAATVLDVTDSEGFWGDPKVIKEVFGTEVRKINSPEINDAYQKAERSQAEKWAKYWIENAEKVVEPSPEEIKKSGAMYVALLDLLSRYRAQAIAIDCLSLFYSGKLPAYPCLGFFQLNNDGLVGACEGDLPSTMMMLLATYLLGRPGYISDPVIDTSKNQIIYAHCVAPSKVFGPKGPANPYRIRNHSEDRKGAAIQSLMPAGELTTSVEFNTERKEIVLHQATTVGNIEEDKACRTKLAAEVHGDINKLLGEWDRFGWHRVTVYGDHKRAVETISALLGIKIIYEA